MAGSGTHACPTCGRKLREGCCARCASFRHDDARLAVVSFVVVGAVSLISVIPGWTVGAKFLHMVPFFCAAVTIYVAGHFVDKVSRPGGLLLPVGLGTLTVWLVYHFIL